MTKSQFGSQNNEEKIVGYVVVWGKSEETEVFLLVIATDCRINSGKTCTKLMPHARRWKMGAKMNYFYPVTTKSNLSEITQLNTYI